MQVLLFDLMDTVVRDPYREAIAAGLAHMFVDCDATEHTALTRQIMASRDPHLWPRFEVGAIDEATFVRDYFRDPAFSLDIEAFHRVRREGYAFIDGMPELLDELVQDDQVQEIHIASNYPRWIEELHVPFKFEQYFDGVFASVDLGVRKPDPLFFIRILERIGREAHECWFVDDRAENCRAAEQLGMKSHLFKDTAGLRAELYPSPT